MADLSEWLEKIDLTACIIISVYEFDVIVLFEPFNIDNLHVYNVPGYEIYYNESRLNKNDGVIMLIKITLL